MLRKAAIGITIVLLVLGCANRVVMESVTLEPTSEGALDEAVLRSRAEGASTAGYSRVLVAGSRWHRIGRIPQGEVWKPLNTVLTVEGKHIREANIVVRGKNWAGYYLPVERAFSPLETPVPIKLSGGDR